MVIPVTHWVFFELHYVLPKVTCWVSLATLDFVSKGLKSRSSTTLMAIKTVNDLKETKKERFVLKQMINDLKHKKTVENLF